MTTHSARPPEASAPLRKLPATVLNSSLGRAGLRALPKVSSLVRRVEFPYRSPTVPGTVEPLPPERRTGVDYDTDWARTPAARVARWGIVEGLARPAVRLIADPDVHGLDRLDHVDGPVIFAANHHSHLDTGLLVSSLPARFRSKVFAGAAADYFFASRASSAASALALNAIPIERTKVTRRSTDLASELLDAGWSMIIFPEGGRSPDGWGQTFRAGAAYLSVRCAVPVIPVHLLGTDRLLPKGAKRLKRGTTVVTFGRPLHPEDGEDARRLGARLEAAVAALADEATTDWWTARRRAHAGSTPSLTGPANGAWRRAWALGDRKPRTRRRPPSERRWPDLG